MRKNTLWISIAFSVLGVVNLILFATLSTYGYVATRNLSYVFAVSYLLLAWAPLILELIFKIKFNFWLIIAFHVFFVMTVLLGCLWGFYRMGIYFDKVTHFLSGVLLSLLAYDLFKNSKLNKINLFWIFVLTVSFAMMCGGVWEIYEFVSDGILNNDAQMAAGLVGHAALQDTILDLVADFGGALCGGAWVTWLEHKNNKGQNVAQNN